MTEPLFQTGRLAACPITDADAPVFTAVYSDPEAVRWVGDGQPITPEESAYWVQVTLRNYRERGYGMIQLLERGSGALVGCCGIVHPGQQEAPEVKYCLLREHWGKGYATEALQGLIGYGESVHSLTDYVATVAPENLDSQKVLAKCGFQAGRLLDKEDGTRTQVYFRGNPAIQDRM